MKKIMKKVMLVVTIATLGLGTLNAQGINFGAKGGLNISNFVGDIEDSESKIGFNIGVFAEIVLLDKLIFQPEILFSTQGAKNEDSFDDENYISTIKVNYLNIPLMLKYAVSNKFSLEFGPQVGFLLSANANVEATMDGSTISVEESVKESFNNIDFGLNFGASFDLTEKIIIGARYNLGLSNVANDEEEIENEDFKVSNTVFSFSVGYKF